MRGGISVGDEVHINGEIFTVWKLDYEEYDPPSCMLVNDKGYFKRHSIPDIIELVKKKMTFIFGDEVIQV